MPVAYKEQITATFRDNAIRSVLFIDDDYLSYSDLSKKQKELLDALSVITPELADGEVAAVVPEGVEEAKILFADTLAKLEEVRELTRSGLGSFKRTKVAEEFVKFFHGEKFICDVESQTNDLKTEKIRKSDLIILDYCLTGDDPSKSLQLLRSLSVSKHLNLVVIYTNKPLGRVWQEIASTLRTPNVLDKDEFFKDDAVSLAMWNASDDLLKGAWVEASRTDQVNYILGKEQEVIDKLRPQFWQDIEDHDDYDGESEPTDGVIRLLIEKNIRKSHMLTDSDKSLHIHGEDGLWIQCGEVFITLCKKEGDDDEGIAQQPQAVWDRLKEALHMWYPSFYRIVLSELQNRIEDSNFSMSKILGKSEHEQVALLWSVLKEPTDKQFSVSESILRHLLQDISDELLYRDGRSAPKFILNTATSIAEQIPPFVKFKKNDPISHNIFLSETLGLAKENYRSGTEEFSENYFRSVAHAHNELLSTQRSVPDYITTGMVLKSRLDDKATWYVCVSPSCDTVPEQEMDDCARALSPHRLLSFIKLKKDDLEGALKVATQSSHIFINDEVEGRVALRVVNEHTKQPDLVQFIVNNHNLRDMTKGGTEVTTLSAIKKKKDRGKLIHDDSQLFPVGILKPAYSARFQAVKSHHEGRIGVDYSPAVFSGPIEDLQPESDCTE
ncbi:hypothetical protein CWO04_20300 [Vibrio splendidus]|uniref:response regulator receiver domain n=1 Tax=Vibrio splendidus TaxID=29497 RepID=UPI000D35E320|nr:response regulator receiver domain [Vibrio splendidus]PTP82378.1 hypothetical protein CWO04_20300 [Vibrio splendidus]